MTFMQFVKSYYKKLSYVISILYIWEVRAHAKQPSVWGWNHHISPPPPKLFVLIPHDTITSDTMPSTVIVKMNTCSKTHKVTVSMRDDGNLDVDIQTDCKNVQHYADHLKLITIDDATNFNGSKIIDPDIRGPLSAPCLCPNAVFDAAWIELGMLAKGLCKKVHGNELILDKFDEQ